MNLHSWFSLNSDVQKQHTMYVLNARNGLAFKNIYRTEHVSMFLSTHAHHADTYCQANAMPHAATIHLLQGGIVYVIDASTHKPFPDSLVTGLGSWVMIFNRAIRVPHNPHHATPAMMKFAWYSDEARRIVSSVRRLESVYPHSGAAEMYFYNPSIKGFGYNGKWTPCMLPVSGPAVVAMVPEYATWDDKPQLVREMQHAVR